MKELVKGDAEASHSDDEGNNGSLMGTHFEKLALI